MVPNPGLGTRHPDVNKPQCLNLRGMSLVGQMAGKFIVVRPYIKS